MTVSQNKVVSLTYELRRDNASGEVIETVETAKPLTFLYGAGLMLPKFEAELNGLDKGAGFDFSLQAEEAYGTINEDVIIDLPKETFVRDGELQDDLLFENNIIQMQDKNGNMFNGRVLEVAPETVKMDFNHPLAGTDLHFKGEIVEVREATPEELEHKHVHEDGKEHDCENCDQNH